MTVSVTCKMRPPVRHSVRNIAERLQNDCFKIRRLGLVNYTLLRLHSHASDPYRSGNESYISGATLKNSPSAGNKKSYSGSANRYINNNKLKNI